MIERAWRCSRPTAEERVQATLPYARSAANAISCTRISKSKGNNNNRYSRSIRSLLCLYRSMHIRLASSEATFPMLSYLFPRRETTIHCAPNASSITTRSGTLSIQQFINKHCPAVLSGFKPSWWLPKYAIYRLHGNVFDLQSSGHAQTAYCVMGDFSHVDHVKYDRLAHFTYQMRILLLSASTYVYPTAGRWESTLPLRSTNSWIPPHP